MYPASVLITPVNVLEEINMLLYSLLWDGKRPEIAAKILENKFKLPNIFLKTKAWQLTWQHCDLDANLPFMISLPPFYKVILTTWFQS